MSQFHLPKRSPTRVSFSLSSIHMKIIDKIKQAQADLLFRSSTFHQRLKRYEKNKARLFCMKRNKKGSRVRNDRV